MKLVVLVRPFTVVGDAFGFEQWVFIRIDLTVVIVYWIDKNFLV